MTPLRVIDSAAPIRICDIGGWTDTAVARHGKVFNIAVRPLVRVRLAVFAPRTRDAPVVIDAWDYGVRYVPSLDGPGWGPHPLLEAAIRAIRPPKEVDIELTIHSQAPAGASTGTSAAVVVAMLGALDQLAGARRSLFEIAMKAHEVETRWLGRQSGVQDQLCSAFGGVNYIETPEYPRAVVAPIRLDERFRKELDRRIVVIYLGRAHNSSAVHEEVIRRLERIGPDCPELEALRAAAERARDAALAGDVQGLGRAMQDNINAQAALHPGLVHPDAWRVAGIAAAHGAAGWKVNGAGGDGGSMTLLCGARPSERRAMIRAIGQENPSFTPIPHVFSRAGLRVWPGDVPAAASPPRA
ncbi:MAG TPA: hypothetical protein VK886_08035 [Vicinamibacterales bacterium]|nr:hypothetical protein [Vicinamibacterales bacterium]